MTDPFDTDETEVETTDTGVSLTFKGDGGYHSPWIVLRGPDVETVTGMVNEELQELMKLSAKYAKAYYELAESIPGERTGGGKSNRGGGNKPGPTEHPDGKVEYCAHDKKMRFMSGISKKNNKPYSMFVCDADVPRDEQCKPKNA